MLTDAYDDANVSLCMRKGLLIGFYNGYKDEDDNQYGQIKISMVIS